MSDVSSITRRLEDGYHDLTPQLRKAARFIVKAPTEIALYSLREVAARAQVGPTTLVRLAAQLGFPSYNAFGETFREGLRWAGLPKTASGKIAKHLLKGEAVVRGICFDRVAGRWQ